MFGLGRKAKSSARSLGDNPVVEYGARLGYAANGLLHILIGWLAIQMAMANTSTSGDQSGALQTLAGTSLGKPLLWICCIGFVLLAIWQLLEVLTRHHTSDRIKAGAKALAYLAIGWTALVFARGDSTSSKNQSVDVTASMMKSAAGKALVIAIGLAFLGIGGYHIYKGYRRRFLSDLAEHPGPWVVRLGRIGYISKGIALGLVGVLFIAAVVHSNPQQASGLDGALHLPLTFSYGQLLLYLVAAGIIAFGGYSFARAKFARV